MSCVVHFVLGIFATVLLGDLPCVLAFFFSYRRRVKYGGRLALVYGRF
jgi:hypothetical protein